MAGENRKRQREKAWKQKRQNPSLLPLQERDVRGQRGEGVGVGREGWLGGEEWGIVMSSPTVTNDRTEFANCDRTQLLPKGRFTRSDGNVSSAAEGNSTLPKAVTLSSAASVVNIFGFLIVIIFD